MKEIRVGIIGTGLIAHAHMEMYKDIPGVTVAADGTVTVVSEDPEYGHNVWIDHGNGYTTIYRNQGEVKVKQGETVTQGTTLFIITDESSKLGYQMMQDGAYVNPMDMLEISG